MIADMRPQAKRRIIVRLLQRRQHFKEIIHGLKLAAEHAASAFLTGKSVNNSAT